MTCSTITIADLEQLDLLVAVDLYVNESTRLAHYILPPAFGLERDHYGLLFHAVAVRNTAKYHKAVVPAPEGVREDWRILLELTTRVLAARGWLGGIAARAMQGALERLGARGALDWLLRFGPHRLSLRALEAAPEGVDLGPLEPRFPGLLRTRDRKICVAPPVLVADLARVERLLRAGDMRVPSPSPLPQAGGEAESSPSALPPARALLLIGRRQMRSNNSWMHNAERLVRGRERCILLMSPVDAERAGIRSGARVEVRSRVGSLEVGVELSDEMMPGVVSLPHGFGHGLRGVQLRVAQVRPGVSANDVTDDARYDAVSGTSALNGVPVTVRAV